MLLATVRSTLLGSDVLKGSLTVIAPILLPMYSSPSLRRFTGRAQVTELTGVFATEFRSRSHLLKALEKAESATSLIVKLPSCLPAAFTSLVEKVLLPLHKDFLEPSAPFSSRQGLSRIKACRCLSRTKKEAM